MFWTQLHRVAAPFGELAWDHARSKQPGATELELADAVGSLLRRAADGPAEQTRPEKMPRRDRRVAARTRAAQLLPVTGAGPDQDAAEAAQGDDSGEGELAGVIPMPIFDPFAEADKPW